jgi:hypothetical protein
VYMHVVRCLALAMGLPSDRTALDHQARFLKKMLMCTIGDSSANETRRPTSRVGSARQ